MPETNEQNNKVTELGPDHLTLHDFEECPVPAFIFHLNYQNERGGSRAPVVQLKNKCFVLYK